MVFDTDMFIWVQRGNAQAAAFMDEADARYLSLVTYMELLQGAKSKAQLRLNKSFVQAIGFRTLPILETIGHRAAIYIEEYALAHGLRVADALVAATATEHGLPLMTSNVEHYQGVHGLDLVEFKV